MADLIRSRSNSSGNYDGKYMKIKFNSDYDLLLKKALEFYKIILFRSVFHEGSKLYLQIFFYKCLYKLA